jgi:hypothetical protein
VVGGEYRDLQEVFEVTEVRSWDQIPASATSYQLVIVCTRLDSLESVAAISRVIDPVDGVAVLLGPSRAGPGTGSRPQPARWRSTGRRLRDSALETIAVYGALPDPWAPEYVFPLTRPAASFAIERFLLSRRPSWEWLTRALRVGPLVRLAIWALPGGLLVCRPRGVRR